MLGGYYDEHPCLTFDAPMWWRTQLSPGMSHLPPTFTLRDGIYQLKKLLAREVRVLMRLRNKLTSQSARAPARPGFRRGLGAYVRQGTGLLLHDGHVEELWDPPDLQRCSGGAIRWAGVAEGGRDTASGANARLAARFPVGLSVRAPRLCASAWGGTPTTASRWPNDRAPLAGADR